MRISEVIKSVGAGTGTRKGDGRGMTVNKKREIEMLSPGEISELQRKSAVDAGQFASPIDEAIADEKAGLPTPL